MPLGCRTSLRDAVRVTSPLLVRRPAVLCMKVPMWLWKANTAHQKKKKKKKKKKKSAVKPSHLKKNKKTKKKKMSN
eukprot:NODE_21394_length_755_cov_3.132166.p5 GENE.NODE_21394_length_755_cov_3.132166~~NODE_21394_length_755_cov_3.132166.p5  ORF type:complete len:76 (-),score=40.31 NODE_21394_length_755_cov_3.132166:32-259(-)